MRILGLDLGEKRIGVSISDETGILALPYKTVSEIKEIKKICHKEKIKKIIVGLPKTLKGEEGKAVFKTKKLAQKIKEITGLPMIFEDERFSTKEAQNILRKRGLKGKKAKEKIDTLAAVLILEQYLQKNV